MKRIFLPCLFSKDCTALQQNGVSIFIPEMQGYYKLEDAEEKARQLALTDPKAKVVIFESTMVIEPRKIEFATKRFNESGELLA